MGGLGCVLPSEPGTSRRWEQGGPQAWRTLGAGEQLGPAALIPEEAWRPPQGTRTILALVGCKEAGRLEGKFTGVGDGVEVGGEGKGVEGDGCPGAWPARLGR